MINLQFVFKIDAAQIAVVRKKASEKKNIKFEF